jgi:RHS repeat-associated protein
MKRLFSRLFLFLVAGYFLNPLACFSQGTDNPTSVAGVFNGNSNTGCSYDPYTANATRVIPDLTVAGAVGAYPLQWARIMNSRLQVNQFLGAGGGWKHSYQWSVTADSNSVTNSPVSVYVTYPDGRKIHFTAGVGTPLTPPLGVTERFKGGIGTTDVYAIMTDGGMVKFRQTASWSGEDWNFSYGPPQEITDPYGLVTTLTYDASNRLIQVMEPAGRALSISYGTIGAGAGYISEVDAIASDGHVSQWVKYFYRTQTFGVTPYDVLYEADYIYTAGLETQPKAFYTYQASNVTANGTPLIETCNDVRYPGPMQKIWYVFKAGGSYGQLYQEKHINNVDPVLTLAVTGSTRTETRGDGPNRVFTYGATPAGGTNVPYLLKSYTDFVPVTPRHTTTLGYDANGYVSSVQDPKLHTTNYTRIAITGVISKITHPVDGSYIQYTYEDPTLGYYLKTIEDELHHITTYVRNADMTVQEIDYPDNGKESYTYNGYRQVLTHIMPSNTAADGFGGTETFAYNDPAHPGQLSTYTPPATSSDNNPGAHPTRYTYNVNDHLSTVTDPLGNMTTLYHNEIGQLTIEQHDDADGSTIVYAYNTDGTLASQNVQLNAAESALTSYAYDDYKRLITLTDPAPNITTFYYDSTGGTTTGYKHTDSNVTRIKLPSGKVTQILYDENLRKAKVTVGLGTVDAAVTTYTYDAVGNLNTMKDPNGQTSGATWTYNYDARDRLINVIDPLAADRNSLGHTIDYTYDWANNKTSEQRANNQMVTYNTYDERNRLTQMTVQQALTADAVTTYTWANSGKLLSMVDPGGYTYSYAYDPLSRLVTTTYPLFNGSHPTESHLYDIAGNLYQFTTRNGDVATFTYDTRNREKTRTWSTGTPGTRTLSYDDASRMTSCNTVSIFINFTYDKNSRLLSQEEWTSLLSDNNTHRTVSYTYDVDGNRATSALTNTVGRVYDYTARNQIKTISAGGTTEVAYTYDANGNVLTRDPQNNTSSVFVYDAVNRITKITHNFAGATRVLNYAYYPVGNRQYEHRDNNLGNDDFGYDLGSQLTNFTRSATLGGSTNTSATFTFDAGGNRSKLVKDAVTTNYTINYLNGYATVTGVANPTYDTKGNLLTYDGATFTYNSMNRLTKAVKGGITEQFYYDGLDRQIGRSITGGQTVMTAWDGWNAYGEFAPGGTSRLDVLLYGPGNDLVKSTYLGQVFYPDALGSTAHYANDSGTLLESYTYDHYGTPVVYDPAGNERAGGTIYGITRLFTGQQWHAATGLYDNRNRFLLPSLGRFLQPDPIGFKGDPANLYRYCGNNPVNASDPMGTTKILDGSGGWGIYAFNKGHLGISLYGSLFGGTVFGGPGNPNGLSYHGKPVLAILVRDHPSGDHNSESDSNNDAANSNNNLTMGLTCAIGINATTFRDDAGALDVKTKSYGIYLSEGQFGWYETTGTGKGIDFGIGISITKLFGGPSDFAGLYHNDNGGFDIFTGSIHFTNDRYNGGSFGLGLPLPISGSATDTNTILHPIWPPGG